MRRFVLLTITGLFMCVGSPPVRAQEEAVPLDKIPRPVLDALQSKFPKARIDKCTKEKEGDAVVYDLEFRQQNGRKAEADIREGGTYINYEKEIETNALPMAVRDAIEKRYPKSRSKVIMEETEVNGKTEKRSAYEVVLATADNREAEVRVAPEGKILEDTGARKPDRASQP